MKEMIINLVEAKLHRSKIKDTFVITDFAGKGFMGRFISFPPAVPEENLSFFSNALLGK